MFCVVSRYMYLQYDRKLINDVIDIDTCSSWYFLTTEHTFKEKLCFYIFKEKQHQISVGSIFGCNLFRIQ